MFKGQSLPLPEGQWDVFSIRITLFCDRAPEGLSELFQACFEQEAKNEARQRAEFRHQLSSQFDDFTCTVEQVGFVVHVKAEAIPKPTEQGVFYPFLPSEIASKVRAAVPTVVGWFGEQIQRAAVGVSYTRRAESRENAYELLGRFLYSVNLDPENSSEFTYRINRWRHIIVDGQEVQINRLGLWACRQYQALVQHLNFDPKAQIPSGPATLATVSSQMAAFDADINTSPSEDLSMLSGDGLITVINTLFEFADELAEKGEIP